MIAFVRGEPVEDADESIKLFALCESMKWAHLPVAGGLYDQHPMLLDRWRFIFSERQKHEAEEERKQRLQNNKANSSRQSSRRR